MSGSGVTDEDIYCWVRERKEEVLELGTLSILGMLHYDASGRETAIDAITSASPIFNNPDAIGARVCSVSTRHARGLSGLQQFQLVATYGSSGKPVRFLPFQRMGTLAHGPSGLGTEAPSEFGRSAQAMRWGESIVGDVFKSLNGLHSSQQAAIDSRDKRIAELQRDCSDLFVALRNEYIERVKLGHEHRMRELEFRRTTEERLRLIKILPALANAMTGKDIFPTTVEDSALVECLVDSVDEKTVQGFATMLGERSPELSGLLMSRFHAIQQKRAKEAEELRRIAAEATGGTYEQAELDAMGQPTRGDVVRALRGPLDETRHARDSKPELRSTAAPAPSEDSRLMADLFARMGADAGLFLGMLESKDPELAARLRARHAAMTGGG